MPTTTTLRHPSPTEVRELLAAQEGPCAMIYLDLPERPGFDDLRQVAPRFRQLVERAVERLRSLGFDEGARTPEAWLEALEPLEIGAKSFPRTARGLAAFLGRPAAHAWAVARPVGDRAYVGRSPRIRPLLAAMNGSGTYRLLALSANRVQGFEGDAGGLRPVEDGALPASLADAIGEEVEKIQDLQLHGTARGGGPAIFHGHGGTDEEREIDLERFHEAVARAAARLWADRRDPLVLAADESHQGRFRKQAKLHGLVEEGLVGNHDRSSADELHAKAWPIVQAHVEAEDRRTLERFDHLRGGPKTLWELEPAVQAAVANRVWRVWLDPDREEPLHVDRRTGALVAAIGDEDAYDELAAIVIENGGEVRVVRPGLLPPDVPLAVELRG